MEKLKFITIEGIDGSGKSSCIPTIQAALEARGEEVVVSGEPGGTKLGLELRERLLHGEKMDVMTETLLMFAARAEHLQQVIIPALERGAWVLCDRFTDSTLAYQSGGKGVPESKIKMLQQVVQDEINPGLTFIFDVPLNVSRARLAKTNKTPDNFESQKEDFFMQVRMCYKNLVKKDPARCKLIDSSKSIEETAEQVLIQLDEFFEHFEVKPKKHKP